MAACLAWLPCMNPVPASVPATTPAIMGQSRRASAPKRGPVASCQTLVTNEGTIRSEAAGAGAITVLSSPIATVGRPSPITPLTKPASRNVSVATAMEEGSKLKVMAGRTDEGDERSVVEAHIPEHRVHVGRALAGNRLLLEIC